MTDREKELEKNIREYIAQTIELQKEEFNQILEKRQEEIFKEILGVFHQLFQRVTYEKPNKEISYIVISFLNTAIINGSIEFKIDLYDKDCLFDKDSISAYYEFHYFDEIIQRDFEKFKHYIETKMIRVKYHELCRYRRVCMIKYKSAMETCMQIYADLAVRLKSYLSMKKATNIKIMYGELMCKNTILYEEFE